MFILRDLCVLCGKKNKSYEIHEITSEILEDFIPIYFLEGNIYIGITSNFLLPTSYFLLHSLYTIGSKTG
jgi:hypothetical protein